MDESTMIDSISLGDTRELIKELADESVGLVVSDIPYRCVSGGDAKRLCRHYIGFEIDQKYYYIAVKRLTEKTGVSLFEKF